jgi:hypothetical protein
MSSFSKALRWVVSIIFSGSFIAAILADYIQKAHPDAASYNTTMGSISRRDPSPLELRAVK